MKKSSRKTLELVLKHLPEIITALASLLTAIVVAIDKLN